MEIRVSGHQVDTGDALRTHVNERLQAIASKYFSRALSAHVTFGKGPFVHGFGCDIVAHVMHIWLSMVRLTRSNDSCGVTSTG